MTIALHPPANTYDFSWWEDQDEKAWASIQAHSQAEAMAEALANVGGDGTYAGRTLRLDFVNGERVHQPTEASMRMAAHRKEAAE